MLIRLPSVRRAELDVRAAQGRLQLRDVVLLERDERRDARALWRATRRPSSPASVIASTKEGIALGVVIVLPVKGEERHSRGDVPGGPAVDATGALTTRELHVLVWER